MADVDLDAGILKVRRSRNRPKYKHGCTEESCGRKPGFCPERQVARPEAAPTKSRAGRRTIGLPKELTAILKEHKAQQAAEKELARQLWNDGDWMFAGRTGKPLSPNMDYREWKALLVAAGTRDGRLHDARHTAATVLLLLGVPERAVMDMMGWSSSTMVKRYQHITAPVRMDIAARVGGLLWDVSKPERGSDEDRPDDDAAGDLRTA
jgi:integrase